MRKCTLSIAGAWILGACADPARPTGTEQISVVELAVVANGDHGGLPMTRIMTGEAEITGDLGATGIARLSFNAGQETVCFELSVLDIALPATSSHIHQAPPGAAGPVTLALIPPDVTGQSAGCLALARETILKIITDPGAYYVNVHNTPHPTGAVRSQLAR